MLPSAKSVPEVRRFQRCLSSPADATQTNRVPRKDDTRVLHIHVAVSGIIRANTESARVLEYCTATSKVCRTQDNRKIPCHSRLQESHYHVCNDLNSSPVLSTGKFLIHHKDFCLISLSKDLLFSNCACGGWISMDCSFWLSNWPLNIVMMQSIQNSKSGTHLNNFIILFSPQNEYLSFVLTFKRTIIGSWLALSFYLTWILLWDTKEWKILKLLTWQSRLILISVWKFRTSLRRVSIVI